MTLRVLLCLSMLFGGTQAALADPPAAAHPAAGLIYGTVTWPDGEQLTGFIRWKSEEACWDDLFHSGYRDNPWVEFLDMEKLRAEKRRQYYETHGLVDRILYSLNEDEKDPLGWRLFLSRMGDLQEIEINDGEDDFVITADGSRHQIGGYGSDAGSKLLVYHGAEEPTEIRWNDLKSIEFLPVPADIEPYAERLYGTVEHTGGTFTGYIQWDLSETLTIDILDGRLDGKNHDYTMGEIRSLARATDRNATVVVLKDGSTVTMGGSNDVDRGNRGIMIETPDWGRVVVPWKRFIKVVFEDGHGTGAGRESYQNARPLTGTVTTVQGETLTGRLVYDLDEGWHWDILNGTAEDVDYNIPFAHIRTIAPLDPESCLVSLHDGQTIKLTGNQDTGLDHGGILVIPAQAGQPRHLEWSEVAEVTFTE